MNTLITFIILIVFVLIINMWVKLVTWIIEKYDLSFMTAMSIAMLPVLFLLAHTIVTGN